MRGTGGNQFLPDDTASNDVEALLAEIRAGLERLHGYALATHRDIDIAAITIETKRIPSGSISVSVTGDLS